jgi:hypothetical protein
MHQDYLPIWFGEKNKLQEHQSGCVVEERKRERKPKQKLSWKLSMICVERLRPLHAYLQEESRGIKVQNVIKELAY